MRKAEDGDWALKILGLIQRSIRRAQSYLCVFPVRVFDTYHPSQHFCDLDIHEYASHIRR